MSNPYKEKIKNEKIEKIKTHYSKKIIKNPEVIEELCKIMTREESFNLLEKWIKENWRLKK
jgi:RecB family endonuclease NucS